MPDRKYFYALTERIIMALFAVPMARESVRAIGAALAALPGDQPALLGTTIDVLARALVAGLRVEQVIAIQPQVAALLGELASGFARHIQAAPHQQYEALRGPPIDQPPHVAAALYEREGNYRLLLEHIPAITYIAALDESSSTLYTSPQIETILGFTPAEWMADRTLWLQQIYPADRAMVLAALRRSQAGELAPCEYRMVTHDSRLVWFRDEAALARDKEGQPYAVYGVMLDITERKRLEGELAGVRRQVAQSREAERVRIAHDLHDGAVQQLLGLCYLVDNTQRGIAAGRQSAAQVIAHVQALEAIRRKAVDVAGQLRTLISELRPAGLAEFGLAATLEGYVAGLLREGGASLPVITLDVDQGMVELTPDVAHCLFRAAQEALRNALKHAQAQHITLRLQQVSGAVELSVCDDGCGFCVPDRLTELALTGHFGLIGLAEQVDWAGGSLSIRSRPGQGTAVLMWIEMDSDGAPR